MRLLKSALFIIFIVLATVCRLDAANLASINVSPPVREIIVARGETQEGLYLVVNHSDKLQHITIEPRDWHRAKYNQDIPLDSWLKLTPVEFDLEPGQQKKVAYEVTVPEDAVGELVAMIAFAPRPLEEQALQVVFSVSLYVKIKGSQEMGHEMVDFKIRKYKDRKAIATKIILENTGNIHLRPRITVFVENLFRKLLQKTPLQYGTPIYPGETETYDGSIYNFALKPGLYRAVIQTEYTDTAGIFRENVYFLVGKGGNIWFTSFRRPKK
jgi:hypothetical protein